MAGPAAASHPSPPPFAVFASKVKPPAAGSGTIARTPLLNRLRTQSTAVRLVTVVAPPGYGKTTLLAQWAARDERPFAWLTAEPDDAAPLVLLRHLAVALREIGAADRSAFTALREPDAADRSDAAALLANGLAAAPEPFVLVVDDADRIPSGPAGQIVAALADAVPAGSLLVLAGRHAPAIGTARRRAGDTLLELTGRDLAFSPRDVKLYATAVRPGIEDELVGELHHRTEGWPAAVTLALRALADPNDASDATAPDPTERYVADYIRAELLAELSEEQQEFLRRTSILDTLTAPLSDAVLGSRDAAARLEELDRDGRFLIPLDRQGTSFRYHRMVRDVLRRELAVRDRDAADDLHRRAATWFQRHGDRVAAVPFALASGDADRAATMITAIGMQMSGAGHGDVVEAWLDELAAAAPLEAYPAAAALGGWLHALAGHATLSEGCLLAAEAGLEAGAATDPAVSASVALLRGALCGDGVGEMERAAGEAEPDLTPGTPWHAIALIVRGAARTLLDQRDPADEDLVAAGRSAAAAGAGELQLLALGQRAVLASQAGDLTMAAQFAFEARELAHRAPPRDDATTALLHAEAAAAVLRQGRWDDARGELGAVERVAPRLTHALPWLTVQARLALAAVYVGLRDRDAADAELAEAERVLALRPLTARVAAQAAALREQVGALPEPGDHGTAGLTRAELRLLPLLATHLSFREIGEHLYVSRNTVKTQAISIYRKLGASSRSETIARAAALGLVDDETLRADRTM
jgi:LuxR family maltose regulon positive regulatory protein